MHIVKQHSKEFKMQLSERELAVIQSITAALASLENYNADGSVNWNFVDADVFMDIEPAVHEIKEHYEMFDRFASVVEAGIAA
jgi:hypothetical protein